MTVSDSCQPQVGLH